MKNRLHVAVIGAGLSGLASARALMSRGHDVTVVEKARGPGGRMSTRRETDVMFDHGAQYFTARDPRFVQQVKAWQSQGLVQVWNGRIGAMGGDGQNSRVPGQRWVGLPGMSGVCRGMAKHITDYISG